MPLPAGLDGRVALVTGSSRGIGKAIARALAERGAGVAVNYVRRAGEADAVAAAIRASGGKAVAVKANVSERAAIEAMMAVVTAQLGPVDVLVNNAGVAIRRSIDDLTEADFDRTIATNLKSAFCAHRQSFPGCANAAGAGSSIFPQVPRAAPVSSASTTMHRRPEWRASPAATPPDSPSLASP
jgi:3-oxoacyl-[acyl-carrier protein] reductase